MGHPYSSVMSKFQFIPTLDHYTLPNCDVYHQAKQTRVSFPRSTSSNTTLFSLVYCDLWGPYKTCTHGKCTMFLTVVEDVYKCTWVFSLEDKSCVSNLLKNFIAYVQTQFHTTIQVIRSDNGTEFVNNDLSSYLQSLGIIHQTSCPYTPQQNGIAERKHQHLLNVARSLKTQSHVPSSLWGDCILTAAHLINITPSKQLYSI